MDITKFVVSGRDQALLYGDYGTYRAQLSRRLLAIRKRLGRTTKKGAKYSSKAPVTAQDIASNHEFAHLLLVTAERAWAHAMYMKSAHSADKKGITGSTRSHIISRLCKAKNAADSLLQCFKDRSITGATDVDLLETHAYVSSLSGAEQFERQSWELCVTSYSTAWVIYTALATSSKTDVFKDLLSATIEPSIRYGAYQMRLPRTISVSAVARKYFSRKDSDLVSMVETLDSNVLRESPKAKAESIDSEAAPRTISWRSRVVELEDASIAVALAAVAAAKTVLTKTLSSSLEINPRERAAAYDDILVASQDTVDATKHAIDELVAEGVRQDDSRIQSLQITRTAVSYDMISWRIGRNRVLSGQADGSLLDGSPVAKARPSKKGAAKPVPTEKEDSPGRQLARLREKVVLYDSTLQSLDSIKELPGVAADVKFVDELDAKYKYFRALKCLAIARSHALLADHKSALALLSRSSEMLSKARPNILSLSDSETSTSPPNISISSAEYQSFSALLQGELQRQRALVELSNLNSAADKSRMNGPGMPLIDRLNSYPSGGLDLKNLVNYPPKLEPVPVKPLFFDVAWNFIQYPGRTATESSISPPKPAVADEPHKDQAKQEKKGWFGFGR